MTTFTESLVSQLRAEDGYLWSLPAYEDLEGQASEEEVRSWLDLFLRGAYEDRP